MQGVCIASGVTLRSESTQDGGRASLPLNTSRYNTILTSLTHTEVGLEPSSFGYNIGPYHFGVMGGLL